MDEDMWNHPTTKRNLGNLVSFGNRVIPVEHGELASGLYGEGRMAEPEQVCSYLAGLFRATGELFGRKALVTAGPTFEAIDPVRFIGNRSSGKMGVAIARELAERGAYVDLVLGPSSLEVSHPQINVIHVQSAEDMYRACTADFDQYDLAVLSAAVADYTPVSTATQKLKKQAGNLTLELAATKDILLTLGQRKRGNQVLVGFALETNNGKEHALGKLTRKNADMIVLNLLSDDGAGFGHDTNKITIYERNGNEFSFEKKPKEQVAKDIVERITKLLYV
jgi:phosphopantothenoylcysteine decarboxylase/phosphopantothenate--cysteine ligase